MNRRHFLATSMAASAVVASARLHTARAAIPERVRFGVIGTGLRGQVHIGELLKRNDVTIAAICDLEPAMLSAALKLCEAAGHKKPQVYTGSDRAWEQMLTQTPLDAVLIVTPWEWHAPMSIAAMEAKVAVGCEVVAASRWKIIGMCCAPSGGPAHLTCCWRMFVIGATSWPF